MPRDFFIYGGEGGVITFFFFFVPMDMVPMTMDIYVKSSFI